MKRGTCGVWSVECGVLRVKCGVWNVECEVWSGKCGVRSVMCRELTVNCGVWNPVCEVVLGSALCKFCGTKCYWEVRCANLIVQSSTVGFFVQTLQYKVVL